jgi:hypothetical protein
VIAGGGTPEAVFAERLGVQMALDYFRWCWDCGCRKSDCDGYRDEEQPRKCCPDCRHRDPSEAPLALVLMPPREQLIALLSLSFGETLAPWGTVCGPGTCTHDTCTAVAVMEGAGWLPTLG